MTQHRLIDPGTEHQLRQLAVEIDRTALGLCNIMHQLCDVFRSLGIDNQEPIDMETLLRDLF
jgi:hypothetical protein